MAVATPAAEAQEATTGREAIRQAAAECPGPGEPAGAVAEPCPEPAADDPEGTVIRDVRIRIRNVFDPELPAEDRRVFRLANRLHRVTRPGVIRQQLLFGPGDPYSPRLLEETERLLRDHLYLHDAGIRAVPRESGTVDVEVDTQDVWSLDQGAAFGRGGGENTTKLKIEDSNLLGRGRGLAIEHVSSVDRSELFVRYLDPNLLGSRARMELIFSDNSDGSRQSVLLERPFFALDSRWAGGLAVNLAAGAAARYYRRDFGEHLFFATLDLDVARDLDPENQLLLGGDSGLRGYPLRYQSGEQRALLTVEQRFLTGLHPLQLFHVGAAVFFDAGRTWGRAPDGGAELGPLKDIGVGLRLSSRRSALGSVIHLDLAFPLDGDGPIETVQWLVESRSTF